MLWFVDVVELIRYNGAAAVLYNKASGRAAHGHRKRMSAELCTRDGGSARADLRSALLRAEIFAFKQKTGWQIFLGGAFGILRRLHDRRLVEFDER